MFRFADSLIRKFKRPFFLELVTVSMHVPFDVSYIPDELTFPKGTTDTLNPITQRYLRVTNYFDHCLGDFIDGLKEQGLYDDTLLFIVSDHSQDIAEIGSNISQYDVEMAFIAANCGITESIKRTGGQIDVYPTILDIMSISGPKSWRGAGISLLNPRLNSAYIPGNGYYGASSDTLFSRRMREAYDISELIIRGGFFN